MTESQPLIVYEEPGKFAGLDVSTALKRASECLDAHSLEIVFRVTGGASSNEIAATFGMSEQKVVEEIEDAKVRIARYHIKQWTPPTTQEQMVITRFTASGLKKYRRR